MFKTNAAGDFKISELNSNAEFLRPDFAPNFLLPRHGWYRFKEGFSAALVETFIDDCMPNRARGRLLDPFVGSGTTAVEGARLGINVHGVEINPFMAFLTKVKTNDYSGILNVEAAAVRCLSGKSRDCAFSLADDSTLVERRGLEKWLINRSVAVRFEQLRTSISKIKLAVTRDLLLLGLVASMENVANARKDGKCWRYKPKWKDKRYDAGALDDAFAACILRYAKDIALSTRLRGEVTVSQTDARESLAVSASAPLFDGVLTSPPYLNSFDYTDIYRPELLMLQHARNAQDLRRLRLKTLRSHVQVAWQTSAPIQNALLCRKIKQIRKSSLWCGRIPEMINAYFVDLSCVFGHCARHLKYGGNIGVVVADSAYCGVVVPVSEILGEILEEIGFRLKKQIVLRQNLGNGNHQRRSGTPLDEIFTVAEFTGRKGLISRRFGNVGLKSALS